MQDDGFVPAEQINGSFRLNENSLNLTIVEKLLLDISGENPTNPSPNGAEFSSQNFAVPTNNDLYKIDLEGETKDLTINKEELARILRNIRTYLQRDDKNYQVASAINIESRGRDINLGEFLLKGIGGILDSPAYETNEDGLKQSIFLLHQLVSKLQSGETPESDKDDAFVTAQIPEELRRLIGTFDLSTWEFIFKTIVTPLHKLQTYETAKEASLDHTLPDYRRFLNKWLEEAVKTDNTQAKKYFTNEKIRTKLLVKLKFPEVGPLANQLQKSEDDAEKLRLLFEDFNKAVIAIFADKKIEEVFEKLIDKDDLLEGGGGEADADEDQSQEDEEIEEKVEESETITINEAENVVKEALYQLLIQQLEIEEQIAANDFLSSLPTNGEQIVFRQQVKTEIYLQIIDTVNLRPQITNSAATFYDEGKNVIYREIFLEQLEVLSQDALLGLSSSLTTPEKGSAILTAAFEFARVSSNDYAKEDLSAQALSDENKQTTLANLPAAFIAENNIQSYQDLENIPQALFLQEILEEKQQSYLQEKRRLENVFLSYLQNNGANINQLSELDYGLQLAINNELDAYFATLSSAELARLFIAGDSTFRLTTAARLNRELLLGRFKTAGFYTKLHQFTQNNLLLQQKTAENTINQVLQNSNQEQIDLTLNSPEEIDRMSIEEFKKAFPAFSIPDDVTPEVFARFKQQAIQSWAPSNAQQGIIQRLMVAYGSDTSFIYTLNSVDKINFIFGLNLPESLTEQDLLIIQQSLESYWQLQIEKVANERNYYLNTAYADQQNLQNQDSNSQNIRAQTGRLTSRQFSPVFSQTTQQEALLSEQGELLKELEGIENYHYRLYLTEQELSAQKEMFWNLQALAAIEQLNQDQIASAEEQTIAGIMQAQVTAGYEQQAQQGRVGRFARRLGIGKSGKDKASAAMAKANRKNVQRVLSAANPALGALNKLGDTIQDITGLSKDKQAAAAIGGAVGLAAAALRALYTSLGGIVGGVTGAIGGALLGAAFTPFFPPLGAVVGGTIGYIGGNAAGHFIGSNLGSSGLSGLGASATGATTANAAGALPKANPLLTTAGFTIGTFTFITATTALVTQATINSALLLPTLGEDDQISRFVVIEKRAVEGISFDNGELPNPITYQVSIRPQENSGDISINSITIHSMTDTLTVRSKDASVAIEPRIKNKDTFGYEADEQITIGPNEVLEFEYTQEFDGAVTDASIDNRFEIEFTVNYLANNQLQNETTTAFTAETICVGDCPSKEGCWPVSGIITQVPFNGNHAPSDSYDIAAAVGSPVYAPFDGDLIQLTKEDPWNPFGNSVKLTSPEGTFAFAHLVSFSEEFPSGPVSQGDLIGYSGNTGNSSGPHLHYELANARGGFDNAGYTESILATLVPDGSIRLYSPVRSCGEQ